MSEARSSNIESLLDDIKALILLTNRDKLEEAKRELLKQGSIELQVYQLCDGESTTEEIAAKIQKTPENARAVISSLRRKGLVKTVDSAGRKVHGQRF